MTVRVNLPRVGSGWSARPTSWTRFPWRSATSRLNVVTARSLLLRGSVSPRQAKGRIVVLPKTVANITLTCVSDLLTSEPTLIFTPSPRQPTWSRAPLMTLVVRRCRRSFALEVRARRRTPFSLDLDESSSVLGRAPITTVVVVVVAAHTLRLGGAPSGGPEIGHPGQARAGESACPRR